MAGVRVAVALGLLGLNAAAQAADNAAAGQSETIVVTAHPRSALEQKNDALDAARDKNLLPKLGATSTVLSEKAIEALPLGEDAAIDKILLQTPGVSADSAISNPDFHIRNEYANTQYRIDGVALPDGVSALGSVLETGLIGNLNLLDGVLPAQYGFRTAGVVDMSTKTRFEDGGTLHFDVGSQNSFSPRLDLTGSAGQSVFFLTGRYFTSDEGLENAEAAVKPIHDQTKQAKFFFYGASILNEANRLVYMAGAFDAHFQIPNIAGAAPLGDYGPTTLNSADINEQERDLFWFATAALQTHLADWDSQISVFTRTASVNFKPDMLYDLAFNDVASDVRRKSVSNGAQFDAAYRLSDAHILRAGLSFTVEQSQNEDTNFVLPLDDMGNPLPTPLAILDKTVKTGWAFGSYIQDEWRLAPQLTLNSGVRFDQISQFVAANQFSPRVALLYQPASGTSLHAGVARYFTPPMQPQAVPVNLAAYQNTTQQAAILQEGKVRPERATYFDVGWDQKFGPRVTLGVDVYYKLSKDTLDDGQFGQAVVLTQYNYAHGYSKGVEAKASYSGDGWRVYGNFAAEISKGKGIVSNQYLIGDPVELAYLDSHYTYASDAQSFTASWGGSYKWRVLEAAIDGIYGSGLRTGFANEDHTAGYTQWNASISTTLSPWESGKPVKLRLSVINLFDKSYILRSGDGIGEFAPQYGPRREIFLGVSQGF